MEQITKKGKIYLGDSLKIIKTLPDKSIDMILTDPPYYENMSLKSENNSFLMKKGRLENFQDLSKINSVIKPKLWFNEALRILKDPNLIIWLDDRHQLLDYLLLIKENNLKYYILNLIKINPFPTGSMYLKDHEMAIYIYSNTKNNYTKNYDDSKTIYFDKVNHDSNVKWHPTPKPLSIIKKQIEKHTQENDIVLDLFLGSGTTAVACEQLNRRWIGIELNNEFYNKSKERILKQGSQKLFNFDRKENNNE